MLLELDCLHLERRSIYQGHLILVNRDHPVRMTLSKPSIDETCKHQLAALLEACHAGEAIRMVSGYRSYSEQQHIYATSLQENGIEFTQSYVARPGESEHQTGLAIDVGESREHMDIDFIRPHFPDHGVCQMFKRLAASFGFIQRYKEGKENMTNIACEPWHFRYVGIPHTLIMEKHNLCLEEYTEFIKAFTYQHPYDFFTEDGLFTQIYYVQAVQADQDMTTVPILNGEKYHLSGNNKDGFVVTVFCNKGRVAGGL
jgi:zinc D-Ala-D-Ala dipeptidase/carboxypeptidase